MTLRLPNPTDAEDFNQYPKEGIGMKSFKQAPEFPRHADIPKAKRSYTNLLFEPSYGGWEEEPRKTQYRDEERYVPPQNSDRANYLIFKDLDRQGANFPPKRMEQKALNQNNQGRPWMATNQSKEEKPRLASKRNTPTSPAPPTSKREYPPQKRVNTGKEAVTQGDQEVLQEQFTLVKGVPDWFLKKIKLELFQGYKDLSKAGLLKAMLVEQECREGSSSPMETSVV
ncbi:hypothetical protein RHGRI_011256 [Rhododendron griersonianum]|uniref:Uncharacterized protein n=1 Tax=Rhododendron griersonianum TaxID=479676 RepID=A0AAV6KLX6_9ERIC|nr:hypothetical protein RHGRI_011256 [Rhododendron griersonianum]